MMRHTFELYLTDPEGETRFEPLTCLPHEVRRRAEDILQRTASTSVEVRQFGEALFSLGRGADESTI